MTWVAGDAFNLMGCYLEPSTLPTQFYMALLYTVTTLILLGQVIYYQHYLKWWNCQHLRPDPRKPDSDEAKLAQGVDVQPVLRHMTSQPIAYAPIPAHRRDLYYTSARSLARSQTPTAGSFPGSGRRSAHPLLLQHHSLDGLYESETLAVSIGTSHSVPTPVVVPSSSPPVLLRGIVSVGICFSGLNIGRFFMTRNSEDMPLEASSRSTILSKRKLLVQIAGVVNQASEPAGSLGMWLGWMMAAIYMGGRLPQIFLNIRRGSVEGLNPLMFAFALLGNATYVGSILIRSIEWCQIKSNMPWLVDAGACVALDSLILCQFIYYWTKEQANPREDFKDDYKSLA